MNLSMLINILCDFVVNIFILYFYSISLNECRMLAIHIMSIVNKGRLHELAHLKCNCSTNS